MWFQQGDLDVRLTCATDTVFAETSSGELSYAGWFCPEDLPTGPQPARTMAAHSHSCQEEQFQVPCYPSQVPAPRTSYNPLGKSGKHCSESFSSAKSAFLVLSDQAVFVAGGERLHYSALLEAGQFSILKPFAKGYSLHVSCS